MTFLIIFLLSLIASALGRMGGMGGEGRKMFPKLPAWFFDSKVRDLGIPSISFIASLVLKIQAPWYIHFFSFLLLFGSLTTYWDWLWFNKGKDNLWLSGFLVGVAYLPHAWYWGNWISVGFRAILLAVLWGGLNVIINNNKVKYSDWIEELLRYLFVVATLPIMLF